MSFTLESRCERGDLLKTVCHLVTHTVQIGVLVAFMDYAWTANLDQRRKIHHIDLLCSELWRNVTEKVYFWFIELNKLFLQWIRSLRCFQRLTGQNAWLVLLCSREEFLQQYLLISTLYTKLFCYIMKCFHFIFHISALLETVLVLFFMVGFIV